MELAFFEDLLLFLSPEGEGYVWNDVIGSGDEKKSECKLNASVGRGRNYGAHLAAFVSQSRLYLHISQVPSNYDASCSCKLL
jgi:hypothetical protein